MFTHMADSRFARFPFRALSRRFALRPISVSRAFAPIRAKTGRLRMFSFMNFPLHGFLLVAGKS
jgi:hypothetical protein